MRHKLNNKGTALVEYAILLSFVSVIGFSFVGDKGFAGNINSIINSTTKVLGQALGLQSFNEAALKDALVKMKDSDYKTSKYSPYYVLGSYFKNQRFEDGYYDSSVTQSQNFEEKVLSKVDFGEIEPESWRFFNEVRTGEKDAFLIWSDSNWKDGNFYNQSDANTPLMYAKINKENNTVTYGVGYGNPLDVDDYDARINGDWTKGGGMVVIDQGIPSNMKFFNPWDNANKEEYKAANSSLFTPDYNKAVSLYKELKAATQK